MIRDGRRRHRRQTMGFSVTKRDDARIRQAAAQLGMTYSDFIRWATMEEVKRLERLASVPENDLCYRL